MIGHYLLTLTPEQEERVLTVPFGYRDAPRCLVMTAEPQMGWMESFCHLEYVADIGGVIGEWSPANAYDNLCRRFGHARVNAAIRSRILSNIARRTLAPAPEGVAT